MRLHMDRIDAPHSVDGAAMGKYQSKSTFLNLLLVCSTRNNRVHMHTEARSSNDVHVRGAFRACTLEQRSK